MASHETVAGIQETNPSNRRGSSFLEKNIFSYANRIRRARMRTFDRATNVWNQLFLLYSFSNLS